MKLKVVVVDLEMSPTTRRCLLRLGLPATILLVATAVAHATVPNVFTTGQVLTAAMLNANFASLDGRVSTLEVLVPNATHAVSADTATSATHATSADTATNASHATTADTATALAAGTVSAGLTFYSVPGGALGAPCTVTPGTAVVDCVCPSGSFVVSGGGDGAITSGIVLRESRPLSTTDWRVTCSLGSNDILCATYTLVCSRLGP